MSKYYITMSKTKHLIVLGIVLAMITGMTAVAEPGGADVDNDQQMSEYDFPSAESITADAGMIHEAELTTEMPTDHWTGLFGTADGTLILGYNDDTNQVLYDWEASGSVVYASESETPEWDELQAGDEDQIDALNLDDAVSDSYDNTFTDNGDTFNSNVLNEDIETLNTANTGEEDDKTEFVTYHLADGDTNDANSIFASDVTADIRFDGTSEDNGYEMILPTDYQASSEYHLYVELE